MQITKNPDTKEINIIIPDISRTFSLRLKDEHDLLDVLANLTYRYDFEFKSVLDERLCVNKEGMITVISPDPWDNSAYISGDYLCYAYDLAELMADYIEGSWLKKE